MSLIRLNGVTKKFGGLKAVSRLGFEVGKGEIVGLIGPNGAGKTTVFNLITGFLRPDQGGIDFDGNSLLGLKPHEVCQLGITRTFQIVKPFAGLTVLENVMIGVFHLTKNAGIAKKGAIETLDFLNLTHLKDKKAGSLTISNRKQLEIARALAIQPKLLLLDEPMGGMNPIEAENMVWDIKKVRESGITIIIIEHVMKAIMSLSDRIVVLHHGEKITEGTPQEVTKNQDVIAAYLGEDYLVS
jgi:branched-chain amino acid transport system ATP-binding protein